MKQNKRNSILTQDLRKAFDSVTEERVRGIFRGLGLRGFSLHAATRLTTHDGKLATGAPTSPHLLNLLCYEIDNKLANWAEKRGGTYRRYADDITLSLPTWRRRNLKHGKELMRRLFAEIGIDLHPRKSKITRLGLDSPSAEVIGLAVQPNRATRPKRIRNRLRGKIRQCRKLIKTGDTDYAEFILQTVIGLANYCAGEKLALPNARSKQLLAKRFHKT
jgi:stress response protein YsnF